MYWIVKSKRAKVYVTVEPTFHPENGEFPVTFAWTDSKGQAVRFNNYWHATAVAGALPNGAEVVEVRS